MVYLLRCASRRFSEHEFRIRRRNGVADVRREGRWLDEAGNAWSTYYVARVGVFPATNFLLGAPTTGRPGVSLARIRAPKADCQASWETAKTAHRERSPQRPGRDPQGPRKRTTSTAMGHPTPGRAPTHPPTPARRTRTPSASAAIRAHGRGYPPAATELTPARRARPAREQRTRRATRWRRAA